MTSKIRGALALLLLMGLCGLPACSSMKIHADWEPGYDFSKMHTWQWADQPHKSQGDPAIQNNTLFEKRVMRAVEEQLGLKGYRHVASGDADFQVSFFLVVEDKVNVTTVNNYYGYGPGGPGYHSGWGYGPGGWGNQTVVDQYQQGTLILDVTTTQPASLLWRGSASARLATKTTPEKSAKRINEAVKKILERFPPKPGAKST
jgi:hypothetical protein